MRGGGSSGGASGVATTDGGVMGLLALLLTPVVWLWGVITGLFSSPTTQQVTSPTPTPGDVTHRKQNTRQVMLWSSKLQSM